MEISIKVHYTGGYQSYYLFYSDFRNQYQFKWMYSFDDPLQCDRKSIKEFKWYDTIRECMINAYRGGPTSHSVKPLKTMWDEIAIQFMPLPAFDSDFHCFSMQGNDITNVSFLNYI